MGSLLDAVKHYYKPERILGSSVLYLINSDVADTGDDDTRHSLHDGNHHDACGALARKRREVAIQWRHRVRGIALCLATLRSNQSNMAPGGTGPSLASIPGGGLALR